MIYETGCASYTLNLNSLDVLTSYVSTGSGGFAYITSTGSSTGNVYFDDSTFGTTNAVIDGGLFYLAGSNPILIRFTTTNTITSSIAT